MTTIFNLEAKQLGCVRQRKFLFPAVSFSLHPGELLLVEGANGAGKSSLLRLIAGAATPAAGMMYWNGEPIHTDLSEYTEALHYIGHTNGIRLGLTVAENLLLTGELSQQVVTPLAATLDLLQLTNLQHQQTQFLSAGQKRRTALARLFFIKRKLWILDEPFTALDAEMQQVLLTKIEEHLIHGGMCVMTSHQPLAFTIPIQSLRLSAC